MLGDFWSHFSLMEFVLSDKLACFKCGYSVDMREPQKILDSTVFFFYFAKIRACCQ